MATLGDGSAYPESYGSYGVQEVLHETVTGKISTATVAALVKPAGTGNDLANHKSQQWVHVNRQTTATSSTYTVTKTKL